MATKTNKPWGLQPNELEKWYNKNIQSGTSDFKDECQLAIDKVVRHIHRVCFTHPELFDVNKVVKGGSFGKGTMVQDLSDVDMVVFINPPHLKPIHSYDSPQEYKEALRKIIAQLRSALELLSSVVINKVDEYLVSFELKVGSRLVEFDLLPTADNFGGGKSMPEIFQEMLEMKAERANYRGFYSASLVEYQRDFVGSQPVYVKELIRLVKYWAYNELPKELQKSYPLELITIYNWQKAGSPVKFIKAHGLKAVLTTLTNLGTLRHYWTKHYLLQQAEECIRKLEIKSPVVLDPANPTNNACNVYWKEKRTKMESIARSSLQYTLLDGVNLDPNWN